MTAAGHERVSALRNVLWINGDTDAGWRPGGFTESLLNAWSRADSSNRERLSDAFPALGWAVNISAFGGTPALRVALESELGAEAAGRVEELTDAIADALRPFVLGSEDMARIAAYAADRFYLDHAREYAGDAESDGDSLGDMDVGGEGDGLGEGA